MHKKSVGIIGAGLAGLTTAYYLSKANIPFTILEARSRLGGRIHTLYNETSQVELGATWLGKKHTFLNQLLKSLDIDIFEQFMGEFAIYDPISTSPPQMVKMPFNEEPTFRIKGGSSYLIQALASKIDKKDFELNTVIRSIKTVEEGLQLESDQGNYTFDFVVSTLPPKLLVSTIKINPEIPEQLLKISQQTHTWMSESIKVAMTYDQPFWKLNQPIGSIFSNTGIITEMYDHCDFDNSRFALMGFINGAYAFATKEERLKRINAQLSSYFGNQVNDYITYHELIWRNEEFTHFDYEQFILPHQNNGNEIFNRALLNGKLLISGSETATAHPGYMDGAVESGINSAQKIIQSLK